MRALSLTQPWATLVAVCEKRWETRSWSTSYRGSLAIHAAKGFPSEAREFCRHPQVARMLKEAGFPSADALPRGAIVAVARLAHVGATCNPRGMPEVGGYEFGLGVSEGLLGNFSWGRFGWLLQNVQSIPEPIPCRGTLGLWTVPAEIVAQLGGLSVTMPLTCPRCGPAAVLAERWDIGNGDRGDYRLCCDGCDYSEDAPVDVQLQLPGLER